MIVCLTSPRHKYGGNAIRRSLALLPRHSRKVIDPSTWFDLLRQSIRLQFWLGIFVDSKFLLAFESQGGVISRRLFVLSQLVAGAIRWRRTGRRRGSRRRRSPSARTSSRQPSGSWCSLRRWTGGGGSTSTAPCWIAPSAGTDFLANFFVLGCK